MTPSPMLVVEPTETVLCCFPYAGGDARIFQPWRDLFPASIRVLPIEYPGHGRFLGAPLESCLARLVEGAATELRAHADRPMVLFGHSLGALIAFEVARLLGATAPVRQLIVGACKAPPLLKTIPNLEAPSPDGFLPTVARHFGTAVAAFVADDQRRTYEPILRNDLRMVKSYRFRDSATPLAVPILALGGRSDPSVDEGELAAWRTMTGAGFSLRWLPGGHFFVHGRLIIRELLQALRDPIGYSSPP